MGRSGRGLCSPRCRVAGDAPGRVTWVWAWWEGLCCCRVPALGSTYKYSKLCTGRTHAASLGNSSDPLRLGRGGQEALMAGVCNQHLQLAPAPAGLKGSAIKCTIPRCRSSPTAPCHAGSTPFSCGDARGTCLPGWDKLSTGRSGEIVCLRNCCAELEGVVRAGGEGGWSVGVQSCMSVQPVLASGAGGWEMPNLPMAYGRPRGKESGPQIVFSPWLLPVFTPPCSPLLDGHLQ